MSDHNAALKLSAATATVRTNPASAQSTRGATTVRDAGETQHGERQRRAGKYVQIQVLVCHKPRRRTHRTATVNSHAG